MELLLEKKLSKLVAICCAIVVRLGKNGIEKIIVKVEDIAIPQAIGVPANVKTKKLIIKIKTGNISIYVILNYYTFHKKLLVYRLRVSLNTLLTLISLMMVNIDLIQKLCRQD